MVYLIIGIPYYYSMYFATPQSIKGTVNIVILVFVVVALLILLMLSILNLQLPTEFFVTIAMLPFATFSLRYYTHACKKG